MEFDYSRLCGKIVEKFKTQGKFADALKIPRSRLNLSLNNKRDFSRLEMLKISSLLGISFVELEPYFFTQMVQKGEQNGGVDVL